ncbi:MAG TPA: hypothetical protein VHU77_00150 [Candidatus Limnocylindria bacterium]|jgi:hypothetical protein|nr:hypothetical protein [Candidatus Limnocylindria bacterium]
MTWLFLLAAAVCAAAAYYVGWPAWTAYRQREARDLNAERYLAWRGRGSSPTGSPRERPTAAERRQLWLAGLLGAGAVTFLIAFFIAS